MIVKHISTYFALLCLHLSYCESVELKDNIKTKSVNLENDLKYLRELPLEKLLKVKKSVQEIANINLYDGLTAANGIPFEISDGNNSDYEAISNLNDYAHIKHSLNGGGDVNNAITALPLTHNQYANIINR